MKKLKQLLDEANQEAARLLAEQPDNGPLAAIATRLQVAAANIENAEAVQAAQAKPAPAPVAPDA